MDIPVDISLEQLNQFIVAFLLAGANKNPVTSKEASQRIPFSYDVASRQMPFLTDSGILVKEGRKGYRFTEEGARYAKFVNWNQEQAIRESLSKILREYELSNKLIHFVKVSGPVSLEKAADRVGVLSQRPSSPRYKRGARTFIDLMVYAGTLREEEGMLMLVDKQSHVAEVSVPLKPVESETVETARRTSYPVTLSFNIDSQTDLAKLRKILGIIRDELLEPKNKQAETKSS